MRAALGLGLDPLKLPLLGGPGSSSGNPKGGAMHAGGQRVLGTRRPRCTQGKSLRKSGSTLLQNRSPVPSSPPPPYLPHTQY